MRLIVLCYAKLTQRLYYVGGAINFLFLSNYKLL